MKIDIIPYDPAHARKIIETHPRDQEQWLVNFKDFDVWAKGWAMAGPGFSMTIDGEIIACAGVTLLGYGKGEAWSLLSSLFYKYKKTVYKAIKIGLDMIINENNLRRVQVPIFCDFTQGRNLVEHLGFKFEGILKSYGIHGEDMALYGRVK